MVGRVAPTGGCIGRPANGGRIGAGGRTPTPGICAAGVSDAVPRGSEAPSGTCGFSAAANSAGCSSAPASPGSASADLASNSGSSSAAPS